MGNNKKCLIVIVGPTAVGKTSLSIQLAKHYHCDIISADSRQFYKEMLIGTAKPTPEEMQGVRHHFIDSHRVTETFSAGRFEVAALQLLEELYQKQDIVILAGGSGLYVQAMLEGMNDIPPVPQYYRDALYKELAREGLDHLVEELRCVDPLYFNQVDKKNQQRVIRALEVYRATGHPYSQFRDDKPRERSFDTIKIGLELNRELLFERIDRRVEKMVDNGLFDEVKLLLPFRNVYALQTVGYKEVFGYLDGDYDRMEAIRLIKRNTRRYAKRQLTWFKRDPDIHWFHTDQVGEIMRQCDNATMLCQPKPWRRLDE